MVPDAYLDSDHGDHCVVEDHGDTVVKQALPEHKEVQGHVHVHLLEDGCSRQQVRK